MGNPMYPVIAGLSCAVIFGLISSALAARKGYARSAWFFPLGLIGLIVLAFLPFANKPEQSPEEQARLQKTGNLVGTILTGLWVVVMLVQTVMTLMASGAGGSSSGM